LFLRMCEPQDASLGTVPLRKWLKSFDARHARILRRLILRLPGGAAPRMLWEDLVRWAFRFAALD
jgi:hypothetical protein